MTNVQQDPKDLKIQALTERLASIVADYEDKFADVRVEFTVTVEALQNRIADLEAQVVSQDEDTTTEAE
jgi:hypothetical protein